MTTQQIKVDDEFTKEYRRTTESFRAVKIDGDGGITAVRTDETKRYPDEYPDLYFFPAAGRGLLRRVTKDSACW